MTSPTRAIVRGHSRWGPLWRSVACPPTRVRRAQQICVASCAQRPIRLGSRQRRMLGAIDPDRRRLSGCELRRTSVDQSRHSRRFRARAVRRSCSFESTSKRCRARSSLVWRSRSARCSAIFSVTGVKALSSRNVRDRVELLIGRPGRSCAGAHATARIDSLYESSGYYLAEVKADSTVKPDGRIALTYQSTKGAVSRSPASRLSATRL